MKTLSLLQTIKRVAAVSVVCTYMLAMSVAAFGQDLGSFQPYQLYQAARADHDYAAAADYARRALADAETQHGGSSVALIEPLEDLAEVLVLDNELQAANEHYSRVLRLQENALGAGHPDLIPTLDAMASIAITLKKYNDAEANLQRILNIERAIFGDKHGQVIITLHRLRDLYDRQDRTADVARIDSEIEAAEFEERALSFGDEDVGGRRYGAEDGYATVRVFYGTNRSRTGDAKPATFYGGDRGELEVGHLDVTIPETHKYGELEAESRWSMLTMNLGEEARKKRYVLLVDVTPLDSDDFHSRLRQHIGAAPSKDVFVFVHGYNSSFEDAARRAAQLAYDLDFDGTPMMYSWPSRASAAAYTVDEAVVRIGGQKMSRFLENVVAESGAERIHLIAHSMGNRAVIEALLAFNARRGPSAPQTPFDQIVFTAPDVDRDYFFEVFDTISKMASRVTLYASDNDVALQSSKILHGAPRAGQAGAGMITRQGLDSIDMSALEADMLGHTYFAINQGAIHDLFRLFWRSESPGMRCGMKDDTDRAGVWTFLADICEGTEMLQASVLLKKFGDAAPALVQKRIEELTDQDGESSVQEWQKILDHLNEQLAADRH